MTHAMKLIAIARETSTCLSEKIITKWGGVKYACYQGDTFYRLPDASRLAIGSGRGMQKQQAMPALTR